MEIHHKKLKLILGVTITFVLVVLIGGMVFLNVSPATAANFSDNIVRPILGANHILALEQVVFNFNDLTNRFKYRYQAPIQPSFSDIAIKIDGPILPLGFGVHEMTLDPITSLNYFPSLPNEGEWQQVNFNLFPNELVAATTFVRPDPDRSYAIVDILKMNMSKMKMGLVAGTQFPGGPIGNKGPGVLPDDIVKTNKLVAAFSGGFQYSDGQYGMVVGKKTYVPLKKNTATLVIHANGKIEIVNYVGQNLGLDVIGIRQNCPMLIDNGSITADNSLGEATWGWTDNQSSMYTIRTGIGITKDGDLLFAVGKSLLPKTLGIALKSAGAVNAMQLDINPSWTRFIIYSSLGNGQYTYASYDKSLVNGGYAYLHGWNKDFIYLYKAN